MDLAEYNTRHLKLPCLVQPKMDGCNLRIANIGHRAHVVSSGNKPKREWLTFQILHETVVPEGYMLEGEFYGDHGVDDDSVVPVTFSDILSAFASHKDPNLCIDMATPKFVVFAYDMIPLDPTAIVRPYHERFGMLKERVASREPHENAVRLMPSTRCKTSEDVELAYEKYVEKGYEGIVVRDPFGMYESGWRSTTAMKRKPVHDEEFELLDFSVGSGCLRVTCLGPRGRAFGATWHMSDVDAQRHFAKKSQLIGEMVTVSYHLKSEDGIPRAGIVKCIRY
jgi:ATP-dependent DNA ligase